MADPVTHPVAEHDARYGEEGAGPPEWARVAWRVPGVGVAWFTTTRRAWTARTRHEVHRKGWAFSTVWVMSWPPLIALHVTLREWSESDADWYAESTRDPAIQRFTTEPAHLTVGEVRDAIRSLATSDNRHAGLVITDT